MKQEKPSFGRRFLLPVGVILGLWLTADFLLLLITRQPFPLANTAFYRPLMNVLARGRILSLLSGGLIIYPVLFFRGARLKERLLGAMVLPLAYVITAIAHVTAYFPLGEAVYYGFNTIAVAGTFLHFGLISIADVFCRWWLRRRDGRPLPLVRWPHVAGILIGAIVGYVTLIWNGGQTFFYLYQEGYKLLFQ